MVSYRLLAKQLRAKDMTVVELSAKIGMESRKLRSVLNKGGYISLRSAEKICKALDCGIGDILEFEDSEAVVNYFYLVDWEAVEIITGKSLSDMGTESGHSRNYYVMMSRNKKVRKESVRAMCKQFNIKAEDIVKGEL